MDKVLKRLQSLAFCYFNENDVVRHHLVRLIIKAYQQHVENGAHFEENERDDKKAKD